MFYVIIDILINKKQNFNFQFKLITEQSFLYVQKYP